MSLKLDALVSVGSANNVGVWLQDSGFSDQGKLGGWSLKQIVFDSDGTMWCVGSLGNVGKWDAEEQEWIGGQFDSSTVLSLTFDGGVLPYAVLPDNQIYCWDEQSSKWSWPVAKNKQGIPFIQVTQNPSDPSNPQWWGVGKDNNVYSWDDETLQWTINSGMSEWEVQSLTFDPKGNAWCVGTLNNCGKWDPVQDIWTDPGFGEWSALSLTWYDYIAFYTPSFSRVMESAKRFSLLMVAFNRVPGFIVDPVNVMQSNGVNLDFLTNAQLQSLDQLITNHFSGKPELETVLREGLKDDEVDCWACQIGIWITFAAFNVALVVATGGLTALLARQAFIAALANLLGMATDAVAECLADAATEQSIEALVNYICEKTGACSD